VAAVCATVADCPAVVACPAVPDCPFVGVRVAGVESDASFRHRRIDGHRDGDPLVESTAEDGRGRVGDRELHGDDRRHAAVNQRRRNAGEGIEAVAAGGPGSAAAVEERQPHRGGLPQMHA